MCACGYTCNGGCDIIMECASLHNDNIDLLTNDVIIDSVIGWEPLGEIVACPKKSFNNKNGYTDKTVYYQIMIRNTIKL
jgi:hypothetical protein